MTTALQPLQPTKSEIQSFERGLTKGLQALVISTTPQSDLDLITPEEREQIEPIIRGYERRLQPASVDMIKDRIAELSLLFPASKLSQAEAQAQLSAYARALSDVPPDALDYAIDKVTKTCRFFPTVAEIREAANYPINVLGWKIGRLRFAADRFDREYQEPKDSEPVDEAEVAAILSKLGIKRDAAKPIVKSYEDYLAMGLTPDEARQCVEQAKNEGRIAA